MAEWAVPAYQWGHISPWHSGASSKCEGSQMVVEVSVWLCSVCTRITFTFTYISAHTELNWNQDNLE